MQMFTNLYDPKVIYFTDQNIWCGLTWYIMLFNASFGKLYSDKQWDETVESRLSLP